MSDESTLPPEPPAPDSRLDPRRVERVALLGFGMQAAAAVVLFILSLQAGGRALGVLSAISLAGLGFWALAWTHLRLGRQAIEETDRVAQAERQRRMAGMDRLFEEDEIGQAARNLGQMDRAVAPVASGLLALALLAIPAWPLVFSRAEGQTLGDALAVLAPVQTAQALLAAAVAAGLAVALFLCGMYGAGLAREARYAVIRAGSGFMLLTALLSLLSAIALGMAGSQWRMAWPDQAVHGLCLAWMALQGLEILINLVLNAYRPRVPGVPARPAYDSRLSGLLAEPTGIFRTFAHTLDYQFGFKVSETWFFRFLERSFAPLVLIWFLVFYLMTGLVVVRPGERAVIERFGRPRGVASLDPSQPEEAWDAIRAEPLGPGLHFKWPWPVEAARVVPARRIQTIYSMGSHFHGEAEEEEEEEDEEDDGHGHGPARPKAKKVADPNKPITWDEEHSHGQEYFYPVPRPDNWLTMGLPGGGAAPEPAPAELRPSAQGIPLANLLYLAGSFSLRYRLGDRPGDPYRFLYRHADPLRELSSRFERELAREMAGGDFWTLLMGHGGEGGGFQDRVQRALQPEAGRLGLVLLSVDLENIHPPVGNVGRAFQELLAERERRKGTELAGLQARDRVLREAETEAARLRLRAESYRHERAGVSRAEADRYARLLAAYRAAPALFAELRRLEALGGALARASLVVVPPDMRLDVDNTRVLDETMATLLGESGRMAEEARPR